MARYPASHDSFIKSSICVARAAMFDGLEFQWLYPTSQAKMDSFETLIRFWHKAIADDAINSGLPRLLLVATVPNIPYLGQNIQYPFDAIIQTLDWMNLLCYDFYTPTSSRSKVGPSSAYHNPWVNGTLSAHFSIMVWNFNLPSKKIVFGIPFYGWAWKLANSYEHEVFSKANGAAKGENISPNGQIYYSNVKQFIHDKKSENVNNDTKFTIAYTYSGTTWIAYESEYSIADKIQKAKSENVLGHFAFNIAADDVDNTLANAAKANWRDI